MSEQPSGVPQWTLADRMRKSLHHSGMSVQGMADYLDVGRNTISNWINDRVTPGKQTRRLWALRTGVPLEWLETGEAPPGGPGGAEVAGAGFEPATSGYQAPVIPLHSHRVAA